MYAKFGCCTMLPNRAQIGPQIRISDKGRHVHDADEPSSVIPMSSCHGPMEMGAVRQRVV